jgi:hypothetical protein
MVALTRLLPCVVGQGKVGIIRRKFHGVARPPRRSTLSPFRQAFMQNTDDRRQQLIASMLASPHRNPDDSLAARLLQPWRSLAVHLSPLIGESGFAALFGRAARVLAPRFAWLAPAVPGTSIDALFAGLAQRLTGADAALAAEANAALLDSFTKLLAGLIGQALTIRLLDAAWGMDCGQKGAQEQM